MFYGVLITNLRFCVFFNATLIGSMGFSFTKDQLRKTILRIFGRYSCKAANMGNHFGLNILAVQSEHEESYG